MFLIMLNLKYPNPNYKMFQIAIVKKRKSLVQWQKFHPNPSSSFGIIAGQG